MAKTQMVTLSTKGENPKKREFELSRANALLKLPKSQWKLDDKDFKWNGSEIAKK
jgi:hypothetical protein